MDVKKVRKKPLKCRRKWAINPKTRVAESGKAYKRQKTKEEIKRSYERTEDET